MGCITSRLLYNCRCIPYCQRSPTDLHALDHICKCTRVDIDGHDVAAALHLRAHSLQSALAKLPSNDPIFSRKLGGLDNALRFLIANLVQFLCSALVDVKPVSFPKGRHPEIWPTTLQDIIP
jgi:hypothetical protein